MTTQAWRSALAVAMILAALGIASCSDGRSDGAAPPPPPTVAHVPDPTLADFVPATSRVRTTKSIDMDGHAPAEVLIATVGTPAAESAMVPANLLLLAWDTAALRWTVAYDGSKQPGAVATNDPFLPQDAAIDGIDLFPLAKRPGGGRDVAVSAVMSFGSHSQLEIGVLRYEDLTASMAYMWADLGGKATPLKHGKGVHAEATYGTAVDAGCCPVRNYSFDIVPAGDEYKQINDDRPFAGVYIYPSNLAPDGDAIVVAVVPGSPADGKIQVGDHIKTVNGSAGAADTINGPTVVHELATHMAADNLTLGLERAGTPSEIDIKAGSLGDLEAVQASTTRPAKLTLGVTLDYEDPLVVNVDDADTAGELQMGSFITAIDAVPIETVADVTAQLYLHQAGDVVTVDWLDFDGYPTSSTVHLAEYLGDTSAEYELILM